MLKQKQVFKITPSICFFIMFVMVINPFIYSQTKKPRSNNKSSSNIKRKQPPIQHFESLSQEQIKKGVDTLQKIASQKHPEDMVFVQGGSFMMGDFTNNPKTTNDKPLHKVTLDSFYIHKAPITYKQFDLYTAANGLPTILPIETPDDIEKMKARNPNNPTASHWITANGYCTWLSELTHKPYSLPSEAQWEYAARNRGQKIEYATNNGKKEYGKNFPELYTGKKGQMLLRPIKQYPPNPLGIYDMGMNTREWVQDWYDTNYYQSSPKQNPKGPKKGRSKVVRGLIHTIFDDNRKFKERRRDPIYTRSRTSELNIVFESIGFRCVLNTNQTTLIEKAIKNPQVKELIETTKKNLVFVKGGEFMMGDTKGTESKLFYTISKDNKPAHKVILDSFYIQKYEVTFQEYDTYTDLAELPKMKWKYIKAYIKDGFVRGPTHPAGTSWYGARQYCKWLAKLTKLSFDLPSEAQWEYAARSRGKRVAYATNTGKIEYGKNFPEHNLKNFNPGHVGRFPPNPLGLYDMSGNAYEWVKDWYDPNYYKYSPLKNPQGPLVGTEKLLRGSVGNSAATVIVSRGEKIDDIYEDFPRDGFRCVVNETSPNLLYPKN